MQNKAIWYITVILVLIFTSLMIFGKTGTDEITVEATPENQCLISEETFYNLSNLNHALLNELKNSRDNYNFLVRDFNKLIEERDFWKTEDSDKGREIELCMGKTTTVPDNRFLNKKTICSSGCNYHWVCEKTTSMLPFFDCNDKVTIFTNIKKKDIQVCDLIAFKTPEHPDLDFAIHQVIAINESGYVTKGISNIHPDKYNVQFEDILGKFLAVQHR